MKAIYKILLIIVLMGFVFLNTAGIQAFNSEQEDYRLRVEEVYSSFVYLFWDLEEFNEVIESSNTQLKNFVDNTYGYYENYFQGYEEFEELTLAQVNLNDQVDFGEKIKNGLGYNLGICLNALIHPLVDFDIYPEIKFENYFARSESSGNIEAEGNMKNGEEKIDVDFEVEGIYENELDLEIRGISMPVIIPAFDKFDLTVGPLYYWGNGEIDYQVERIFAYEGPDADKEELENILDDIPETTHLNFQQDLKISSGLGWKIGLNYNYELQNNLSIFARAYHRKVEVDIEVTERTKRVTEGTEEYIDEENYQEFDDEFSENLGGTEISAGISISY